MEEIILSRNGKLKGKIKTVSYRYCAGCQKDHECYIVHWEDGTLTKPCTAGVRKNKDGILQII